MRLAYREYGRGKPIVLLHGFPLDRSMWDAQIVPLSATYRVVTPDLRGHGESEAADGDNEVDRMADDVIELLDTMELAEPVVVAGLSMGGYVALSIALRYPERLRGLILLNSRAAADGPEVVKIRGELAALVDSSGSSDAVIETMLPRLLSRAAWEKKPELISRVRAVMARTPSKSVAATMRGLAKRADRVSDLPSIKIPTLVVSGSDDQLIPIEESRLLVDKLADARLVVIPFAGHLAPLENPEATNGALLDFLESLR